ncbi:uroporphyrinogen-III synthase [Bacillus subtilis]|uniref:uroporphyrinogen-III synthase n=1 Tax=Bacillus TaxID=1386 RepID=UPI001292F80B|nr:uroporphyrinogen-III synthase [Bacillus subtilis]NJI50628.1 uroporphyrinogen-III synthase [Bacillus subtilis]QFY82945.1 uroporphyrinogen-III synthase [Bacillus subtilis]
MENDFPLKGKTVLVTRNKAQATSFKQKVEALGGKAVLTSLITFRRALPNDVAEQVREDLAAPGWLVFTSVNGADFFFSYLKENQLILPAHKKIAAVGEKTARRLKTHNVSVDVMPQEYIAEQLADALKQHAEPGEPITVMKGNLSRDVIKQELVPLGFEVKEWVLYETIPDEEGIEALKDAAGQYSFDYVTFTSSSTVHTFMHVLGEELKKWKANGTACISIGPLTNDALLTYGITSHTPDTFTIDGMLELMCSMSREEERI